MKSEKLTKQKPQRVLNFVREKTLKNSDIFQTQSLEKFLFFFNLAKIQLVILPLFFFELNIVHFQTNGRESDKSCFTYIKVNSMLNTRKTGVREIKNIFKASPITFS